MTNTELREKITALWNEYLAESPKNECAVLYLSTTLEDTNLGEGIFGVKASPSFIALAAISFLKKVTEKCPQAIVPMLGQMTLLRALMDKDQEENKVVMN